MIIKVSSIKNAGKSSFSSLATYISKPKKDVEERVENVWLDNYDGETDWEVASWHTEAAQAQKAGIDKPKSYHIIVSFRQDEADKLCLGDYQNIAGEVADAVGLEGHQRITALHGDTDNKHLHIAINLLDEKNRFKEPYKAFVNLKSKRKELEASYGFETAEAAREGRGAVVSDSNTKRERHGNTSSFEGWLKNNVADDLEKLLSDEKSDWKSLHSLLKKNGVVLRKRGAGFVLSHAKKKIFIKASSVSRELSMKKLTDQLGDFEPADGLSGVKIERVYQSEKMQSSELFDQYKGEAEKRKQGRDKARGELRKLFNEQKSTINDSIRESKAKLLGLPPSKSKTARLKVLTFERAQNMEKVVEDYQEKSKAVTESFRHKTWVQWLQERAKAGDSSAIEALQRRGAEVSKEGNTVENASKDGEWRSVGNTLRELDCKVAANGRVSYKTKTGASIEDYGRNIAVGKTFDDATVEAAVKLAIAKYGTTLKVGGADAWKAAVTKKADELGIKITLKQDKER